VPSLRSPVLSILAEARELMMLRAGTLDDHSYLSPNAEFDPELGRSSRLHFGSNSARMLAMSVAITVRDVPDAVRDELAARAARAGKSLQEYVRAMLVDAASRPPVADVIARARARVGATGVQIDADSILAARDADRR
jgi:plasmid stability protein